MHTSKDLWSAWERGSKGPSLTRARGIVALLSDSCEERDLADLFHTWWPDEDIVAGSAPATGASLAHYVLDGAFIGVWGFLDDNGQPVVFCDQTVTLVNSNGEVAGDASSVLHAGLFSTEVVDYSVVLRVDGMGIARGYWRNKHHQSEFMGVILGYIEDDSTHLEASWTATHSGRRFRNGRLRWYKQGFPHEGRVPTVESMADEAGRLIDDLRKDQAT